MYLLYVIGLSLMGPSGALALLFYFSHRDNEIIRKHKEQKRLAQIYKQQEQQNLREDAIIHQKYKEDKIVINSIASHHGDTKADSVIAVIVAIADALSASRPGARNDSLENYIKRLTQLEEVGNNIDGVDKAYALQAGRELRVVVKPEEVDDAKAHKIARDVKEKIEATMKYPGTIKITVVRETRAQEEAK